MSRIIKEDKYFIFERPKVKNIKYYIKNILAPCLRSLYKIYMNIFTPPVLQGTKYNVSICAIFKNEAPYIKEWIEFHRIVGIDHFYMYNNNSEDDFRSVLEPYVKEGIVTLIEWPHNHAQMQCYNDCIANFRHETKWLGFIDLDEFIVPNKVDTVYDFLKPLEKNRGSVLIYWKMFCSGGKIERDINGLVTEDFTVCWPKYDTCGKCFYNTRYILDGNNSKNSTLHHMSWTNNGNFMLPPVNVFDNVCVYNIHVVDNDEFPIQINHYFTKSLQEYKIKKSKGDVYFEVNPHDMEYFYEHDKLCQSVDYKIYKYLINLKLAMGI